MMGCCVFMAWNAQQLRGFWGDVLLIKVPRFSFYAFANAGARMV
jgi:hypothetical protein